MQSRAIIPSWYSIGTALEHFCAEHRDGLQTLREMYHQWPFFRALMENAQLDLAKADLGIAALYAALVKDDGLRHTIFDGMKAEYDRARAQVCLVIDQPELLFRSPVMQRSIERRNPYVDPLNFIQVDLLRRLRAMRLDDPAYAPTLQTVLATINGVAAGMKVTG
jgi:phosphoenolpyruvate carboxylase